MILSLKARKKKDIKIAQSTRQIASKRIHCFVKIRYEKELQEWNFISKSQIEMKISKGNCVCLYVTLEYNN